jgi:hypothetical protein
MKKKWFKMFLLTALGLFSLFLFSTFFIVFLPSHSVVKVTKINNDVEFMRSYDRDDIRICFNKGKVNYPASKSFNLKGRFYAGHRNEKFLENDFSFTVLFPYKEINAADTNLLFTKIKSHAYLSLQKASDFMGNNFYGVSEKTVNCSYPELFREILKEKILSSEDKSLKNLYFVDFDITKISYVEENLDRLTDFFISCQRFSIFSHGGFFPSDKMDSLCNQFNINVKNICL